jgi:DNA (cytosine-5)-methyltransferase 1
MPGIVRAARARASREAGRTVLAVDFDRWAAETYSANFPGVDVRCCPVQDVTLREGQADVILGGPPCQPHSLAGKRKASADVRDGGPDFAAAVRKVQPRMFLMENVDGLMTSEGGRYMATAVRES